MLFRATEDLCQTASGYLRVSCTNNNMFSIADVTEVWGVGLGGE